MEKGKNSYYVILQTSPYYSKKGILVKNIDYKGNPNGWYTLEIDGKRLLFSGNEIAQIKEYNEESNGYKSRN